MTTAVASAGRMRGILHRHQDDRYERVRRGVGDRGADGGVLDAVRAVTERVYLGEELTGGDPGCALELRRVQLGADQRAVPLEEAPRPPEDPRRRPLHV